MKKNLNEELKDIKYLFNYDRGRIISEQNMFEGNDDYKDRSMYDPYYDDDEYEEEFDLDMDDYSDEVPSFDASGEFKGMTNPNGDMEIGENKTKEKERIKIDPGTKPKQPKTPYKPKPGPKPDPKARKRKGDMPTWLTFDELGIDFE